MASSDTTLRAVQRRAIIVLLATGSPSQAAEAVGVSLRTVRRWQASRSFAEALRDAARDSAGEALSQLLAAGAEAVEALREAVRTGSPALRVRAAQILLENGLKVAGDDLDQRIAKLEEQAWSTDSNGPALRSLSAG
jgi:transposase